MTEDRASIIRTVQTPLGFFTLLVLVTEVILGGLAVRAEGWDFTILIIGMIVLLFILTGAVYRMASPTPQSSSKATTANCKYDVFLSSVLAWFNGPSRLVEYKEFAL